MHWNNNKNYGKKQINFTEIVPDYDQWIYYSLQKFDVNFEPPE